MTPTASSMFSDWSARRTRFPSFSVFRVDWSPLPLPGTTLLALPCFSSSRTARAAFTMPMPNSLMPSHHPVVSSFM
jgi:hypothetical protein